MKRIEFVYYNMLNYKDIEPGHTRLMKVLADKAYENAIKEDKLWKFLMECVREKNRDRVLSRWANCEKV